MKSRSTAVPRDVDQPWFIVGRFRDSIALLTSILAIADTPSSPLVAGYFVLVALSALRFNVNLIRFATVGVMATHQRPLGEQMGLWGNRRVAEGTDGSLREQRLSPMSNDWTSRVA